MRIFCRHKTLLSALFVLVTIINPAEGQVNLLPQEVRFKTGDNMDWANPLFNDADWNSRRLGTSWKDTVTKENIYVWFRIKTVIPSEMKTQAEKENGLLLHLGKIDDADQTFFNGRLIGQSGSFPPDFKTKWQEDRVYIMPVNEVLWDKENVISVRIFSPDSWVGMYQGPYKYGPLQWSDFISAEQTISETADKRFITKVKLTNKGNYLFNGKIKYRIADKNNNELFTETKRAEIQPVQGFESEIVFSDYQPVDENIFRVSCCVTENNNTASVTKETLYLSDKQVKIEVAGEPKPVVENKVKDVFTSIPFQNQQLQGYLGKRMYQNLTERLLKLDEEGTLDGYLSRPGHHPWAGEHIGKYLETASNVWLNTGDERLKIQMDRLMYQLVNSQLPDGYLGTYTPDEYWTSWDVWSHKYNLYGLLAYYKATGYQPALEACVKIGDLLCTTFGNKPGQRDIIQAGTHAGMAATSVLDPMVELYRYTGDPKYLDFCYYILDACEQDNGPKIISSLLATGKVTKVGNGKTYEMLSNFVGIVNLYRVTGDERLLKPVIIAWQDIVTNKLYITGTTSSHEYFQDDGYLPGSATDNMGEGCVTTTWIQLNQQLLNATGDLKYFEQIEKSIYNHLLGAENPLTGCVSYYTPLMDKKPYTCNITCCQSSVPRGIAMVPYFTFGNLDNIPALMMYEPATYIENITTSKNKPISLALLVESDFPESGDVSMTVNTPQTAAFPISLRVPGWCSTYTATIGNKVYNGIPGQNLIIDRKWKSGDKIRVSFQIPVQILSGGKSYPDQIAFQRGPQVLAYDDSLNPDIIINTEQKLLVEIPENRSTDSMLPKQWIGKQVYQVNVACKNMNAETQHIFLVPFADAGQTGGALKVWMPLSINNK
jgi:DUF1680 family protein